MTGEWRKVIGAENKRKGGTKKMNDAQWLLLYNAWKDLKTIKVDCTCLHLCCQTDHLLITEVMLFVVNWICLITIWVLLILPQALNDDKVPLDKAHIVTIATLTGHAIIAMGPAYSVCHKTFCLRH